MTEPVALAVTMAFGVMAEVEQHCRSRVDVEVGGFLIGKVEGDEVDVRAARRAVDVTAAQTNLTFTHETWSDVLEALPTEYSGQQIVGWYHSHPGFGCFLSEYDLFIQENFFSGPGQHALVVDPIAGTWAQFIASGGASREVGSGTTGLPALGALREGVAADKVDLAAGHRRRVWPVVVALVASVAVVVGSLAWFVGNMQGQDAVTSQRASALSAANDQIAELQDQLASVPTATQAPSAPATSPPSADPTPSPSAGKPSGLPTLAGDVLSVGELGTFSLRHKIERGDTLWELARRYLGDPTRFPELLRANPQVRKNGLEPGGVLQIRLRGTLENVG